MLFAPVRLGNTTLGREELAADRKSCKRFGPCGGGEKALYLNSFFIDRHYYVALSSVRRVFKRVAMSKGGFSGKGFLEGTQTKFNFVPEQSTDFIFCTVGEEWGFLGAVAVLGVMCLLLLRLMKVGERLEEPFGRVYCYSVAAILLFHVLVNVGMTIGLMPVMGIPLPFMSYGGSSLLAFTILLFFAIRLDASTRQFPST